MRLTRSAGVRRRRLLHTAVATGALLVPATAGGQASAATLSASAPCYVNVNASQPAPIAITGAGFTPGDAIAIQGGTVFGTATAGPDGSISLITRGPILPFAGPGTHATTLTAQDETSGTAGLAQAIVTTANFAVATTPSVARPTRKVTWRFSGFTPHKTIYVHYLRNGNVLTRMAFGRAQGPCGTLKTRDRLFPGGHPRNSRYTVVFDQVKRYSNNARPRITNVLSFF